MSGAAGLAAKFETHCALCCWLVAAPYSPSLPARTPIPQNSSDTMLTNHVCSLLFIHMSTHYRMEVTGRFNPTDKQTHTTMYEVDLTLAVDSREKCSRCSQRHPYFLVTCSSCGQSFCWGLLNHWQATGTQAPHLSNQLHENVHLEKRRKNNNLDSFLFSLFPPINSVRTCLHSSWIHAGCSAGGPIYTSRPVRVGLQIHQSGRRRCCV